MHSWLKSSAMVKHLMHIPVLKLSLTKSMLHAGTRSSARPLTSLRLRTARLAAL